MSGLQKIIKYLAMAFAIFLVFSIISGIMGVTSSFTNVFDNDTVDKLKDLNINRDVKLLNIDVKSANIIIKEGNILKAETTSKNINLKQDKDKLYITQKKYNFFNNDKSDLIIYVPSDSILDGVQIDAGAGKLSIDKLATKVLYLELGAGKVEIKDLEVTDKTEIEGGAGSIDILSGNLNNLDLELGVGKLSLTSAIKGETSIEAGIGGVNLNLIGNDYKIKVDKGIGSFNINGEDVKDNTYYGEGNNLIDIEGGIGAIKVKYVDE